MKNQITRKTRTPDYVRNKLLNRTRIMESSKLEIKKFCESIHQNQNSVYSEDLKTMGYSLFGTIFNLLDKMAPKVFSTKLDLAIFELFGLDNLTKISNANQKIFTTISENRANSQVEFLREVDFCLNEFNCMLKKAPFLLIKRKFGKLDIKDTLVNQQAKKMNMNVVKNSKLANHVISSEFEPTTHLAGCYTSLQAIQTNDLPVKNRSVFMTESDIFMDSSFFSYMMGKMDFSELGLTFEKSDKTSDILPELMKHHSVIIFNTLFKDFLELQQQILVGMYK